LSASKGIQRNTAKVTMSRHVWKQFTTSFSDLASSEVCSQASRKSIYMHESNADWYFRTPFLILAPFLVAPVVIPAKPYHYAISSFHRTTPPCLHFFWRSATKTPAFTKVLMVSLPFTLVPRIEICGMAPSLTNAPAAMIL